MGFEGEIGKFGKPEGIKPPKKSIEGGEIPVRLSPEPDIVNSEDGKKDLSDTQEHMPKERSWKPPTTPPIHFDDVLTRIDPTAVDFKPTYTAQSPIHETTTDTGSPRPEEKEREHTELKTPRDDRETKPQGPRPQHGFEQRRDTGMTERFDGKSDRNGKDLTGEKDELREKKEVIKPDDREIMKVEQYTDRNISPVQERMRNVEGGLRNLRENFADWRVKRNIPMDHEKRERLDSKRLNAKAIVEAEKFEKHTPLARAAVYGSPLPAAIPSLLTDRPIWALGTMMAAAGLGYLSKEEKKVPGKFSFGSYSYVLGAEAAASGVVTAYADSPVTLITGGVVAAGSAILSSNEVKNHVAVKRYPKYMKRLNKDEMKGRDNDRRIVQLEKIIGQFENADIDPQSVKPRVITNMERMKRELIMRRNAQRAARRPIEKSAI